MADLLNTPGKYVLLHTVMHLCFPRFPDNLSRKFQYFQLVSCQIKFEIHGFLANVHAMKPKTKSGSGSTYFSRAIGLVRNGKNTSPYPYIPEKFDFFQVGGMGFLILVHCAMCNHIIIMQI